MVGLSVGAIVVGFAEGAIVVGRLVGTSDGDCEGKAVVGSNVLATVGLSEGIIVGARLGSTLTEGLAVGVKDTLGCS